ncbi:MAG: 5-amino-6-(D-ribitylamino)uracil--L-tyrosine 4-hydroxyphenyl transferase CofH [Pseudomonadota bacterium]
MTLARVFDEVSADLRDVLDRALEGRELSVADGLRLARVTGRELHALLAVADTVRRQQVGDEVGYVINRNVNFTNVCVKACRFCAFSRTKRSGEAYFLDPEEIVRRAREARDLGATEVCVQAGLAPGIDASFYVELVRSIKRAVPELHVHAFSPEEIRYGAEQSGISPRDFLSALRDAGLGSLPGTSAEILDDGLRRRLSPGRITTAEWVHVVTSAHELGLPTTSTMMYGHLETDEQRIRHLDLLRTIQKQTGGFTEFVPLSFVHREAPAHVKHHLPGLRPGPTGNEVARLYAVARLMLGATVRNIQVSWVKEGVRMAQWLLSAGANDLGGTLINESISTAAGSVHGQFQPPAELRRLVREAGRIPVQRDTRYRRVRVFASEPEPDEDSPLDRVVDAEAAFGSYAALTRDPRFRYRLPLAST